ncbi:MAG: histone family protein [Candidatus Nanohaloarchaea archaeon]
MSLPKAPVERIIRAAGAERVSDGAVEELRDAVEELGDELARDAADMADHAGRNTVKKEDVEMAVNP